MLTQEEYDDIFPLFMMFVAPWCRTKTTHGCADNGKLLTSAQSQVKNKSFSYDNWHPVIQ